MDALRLTPFQVYYVCSSLIARKMESPEESIILQLVLDLIFFPKIGIPYNFFKHLVTLHAYVCICMFIYFVMHTLGISYGRIARFHS